MSVTKINGDGTATLTKGCIQCRKLHEIEVLVPALVAWEQGELIQNAFPHMDADTRELLISGVCGTCFDALFTGGE